jgi:O-antigen/teichoic acid export membrane protein
MAGIFSANKKLAVFILLVTQAFRYAAEPFFFRHAKETNSRVVFAKVFHYFMLASLATFLLISSFSYEFVSTKIFGFQLISEDYWKGLSVVPPLLFSFVLWGAYTNLSIWFKLTKQVRFGLLFSGLGVFLIMLFNFILIPSYGYMGATIAMLISYAVMTALVFISGQKYYPIPYKILRISIYAFILLSSFWINTAIGNADGLDGVFLQKFLVTAAGIGICIAMEKFWPIDWSEAKPDAGAQ